MTRDLCIMACTFCRDPQFHRWLETLAAESGTVGEFSESSAKEFILTACGIDSRNELDTNAGAAERFHRLVRVPFTRWRDRDRSDFYAGQLGEPWPDTAD